MKREQMDTLIDVGSMLREYVAYGEEMRQHGRGPSIIGNSGHSPESLLAQLELILYELERRHLGTPLA